MADSIFQNQTLDYMGNAVPSNGVTLAPTATTVPGVTPSAMSGLAGTSFEDIHKQYLQSLIKNENSTFLGMDKGTLSGVQGAAGIASSLAGLYFDYQNNKRADEVLGMQKQEYNRGVKKDQDFSSGIAASGLGSYSAGSTPVAPSSSRLG